jgi:hypothetical protein
MENRNGKSVVASDIGDEVWTEAVARRVLKEWAGSGESMSAFARSAGLLPQRLSWWKKRLGWSPHATPTAALPPESAPATFIPVTVRATAPMPVAAAVEIQGGGIRIELHALDDASAAWVASLARALGGTP